MLRRPISNVESELESMELVLKEVQSMKRLKSYCVDISVGRVVQAFAANLAGLILCVGSTTFAQPVSNVVDGCFSVYDVDDYGAVLCHLTVRSEEALHNVVLPESVSGKPVVRILERSISCDNSITNVVFPASLRCIDTDAIYDCRGIERLVIPASVTNVAENAFSTCWGLREYSVESDSKHYAAVNGMLMTKDGHKLLHCPFCVQGTVVVPEGVCDIGNYAFRSCTNLTAVSLPKELLTIGSWAFYSCEKLVEIDIPSSVSTVGDGAFGFCRCLTKLSLPPSMETVPAYLCIGCSALTAIELPDRVTEIEEMAFAYSGLVDIEFPEGFKTIGGQAFEGSDLTSLRLPRSLENLGRGALARCYDVQSVFFSDYPNEGVARDWVYLFATEEWNPKTKRHEIDVNEWMFYQLTLYVRAGSKGWDGNPDSLVLPAYWPLRSSYLGPEDGWVHVSSAVRFYNEEGASDHILVEDVRAVSRSPWTAMVDIDFTLRKTSATPVSIVVQAIGWRAFNVATITGSGTGALTDSGRYRVTWNAGADCPALVSLDTKFAVLASCGSDVFAAYSPKYDFDFSAIGKKVLSDAQTVQLPYDTQWFSGDEVVVSVDGVVLTNLTEDASGTLTWNVAEAGAGTHVAEIGDGQVSWTSTLVVPDECCVIHAGQIPWEYEIVDYVNPTNGIHTVYTNRLSDVVWSADKIHVVRDSVKVPRSMALTIEPGTVVKFMPGTDLVIETGGCCVAQGAVFTHINDDAVGGDTMYDGNETKPVHDDYAVDSKITDDEMTEYRYLTPKAATLSGTISKGETWKGYKVYHVTGDLTIPNGVTLTIEPGAVVKFDAGKSLTVAKGGTLNAIGTRAQPIVFTSIKDDECGGDTNEDGDATTAQAGDWGRIYAQGSVNMSFCRVANCNNNSDNGAIQGIGGTVVLNNCLLERSVYELVRMNSGSFVAYNCIFRDASMAFGWYGGSGTMCYNCVIADVSEGVRANNKHFYNCVFCRVINFGSTSTYRNCCFYNPPGYANSAQSFSVVGRDGNFWADPLFYNLDAGDYRLQDGSPCIDAGNESFAPVKDYYSQPRNGQPDIGIFEAQVRPVTNDVDLSIVSVSVDAQATVGDIVQISWTVENLGSVNAQDSWRDAFEMIDANGVLVKLGDYVVKGGIVAGGKRTFTAKFPVPAMAAGAARLRVKVNPERDIFEGTATENNVAYADGTVDIALASYTEDGYSMVSVGAGSSTALTLPADSGITALIIKGGSDISAYGAYGYVPKFLRNDITAVRLEDGSLLLTLPSTASAGDFTFVIANGGNSAEAVTIEPVTESLEITEVTPNRLANTGDGYLTIRGVALDKVTKVRLLGNEACSAQQINIDPVGELQVPFKLSGVAAGVYDLVVETDDGDSIVLNAAVEIFKPLQGAKLEYSLSVPNTIRAGRVYSGVLRYRNSGDDSMLAPLFRISSANSTMSLEKDGGFDSHELLLLGIANTVTAGRLMPGDSNEIEFFFKGGSSGSFAVTADADSGELWKLRHEDLSRAATILNNRGRVVCALHDVSEYVSRMHGETNDIAICGTFVNQIDGSPMQEIKLVAIDTNGVAVSTGDVDENGVFVIDRLSRNATYKIAYESCSKVKTFVVSTPEVGDLLGLKFLGTSGYEIALSTIGLDEDERSVVRYSASHIAAGFHTYSVTSGTEGKTALIVEGSGFYLISAESKNGRKAIATVDIAAGDSSAECVLEFVDGSEVSGVVVSANGGVISNAIVMAEAANGTESRSAVSSQNGTFLFDDLADGEWTLTAAAEGYHSSTGTCVVLNGNAGLSGVVFELDPKVHCLSGTVPAEYVGCTVVFMGFSGNNNGTAVVEANGRYCIRGLDEGNGNLFLLNSESTPVAVKCGIEIVETENEMNIESADQTFRIVLESTDLNSNAIASVWQWVPATGVGLVKQLAATGKGTLETRSDYYYVKVSAVGYQDYFLGVNLTNDLKCTVRLYPAGTIHFKLPDDLVNESVSVCCGTTNGSSSATTRDGVNYYATGLDYEEPYRMFIATAHGGWRTETLTPDIGVTNTVEIIRTIRNLKIKLGGKGKDIIRSLKITQLDEYPFVQTMPVSGDLTLDEYPDVRLKVEACGSTGEKLAEREIDTAENEVELIPADTIDIYGQILGAPSSAYVSGSVSFSKGSGNVLKTVTMNYRGDFRATSVPVDFEYLLVVLGDGTVFTVSRSDAEKVNYRIVIPEDMEEEEIDVLDDWGNPLGGWDVVLTDDQGNAWNGRSDGKGKVKIKRRHNSKVTVNTGDTRNSEKKKQDDKKKKDDKKDDDDDDGDGNGPGGGGDDNIRKNQEEISTFDLDEYKGIHWTDIDPIKLSPSSWPLWTPWYHTAVADLDQFRNADLHKGPDPQYRSCVIRNCTYNANLYERYLVAYANFRTGITEAEVQLEETNGRINNLRFYFYGDTAATVVSYFGPIGGLIGNGYNLITSTYRTFHDSNAGMSYIFSRTDFADTASLLDNANYIENFTEFAYGIEDVEKNIAVDMVAETTAKHCGNVIDSLQTWFAANRASMTFEMQAACDQLMTALHKLPNSIKNGGATAIKKALYMLPAALQVLDDIGYMMEARDKVDELYHGSYANLNYLYRVVKALVDTPYVPCKEGDLPTNWGTNSSYEVSALMSHDPNEMSGLMGRGDAGTQRYVKPGEWMTYTVYFENMTNATAAAQEVKVSNPLSSYLDWSTFEMGEVAFNNQIDLGLSGKQNGTSEVTMNGTNYLVRSEVTLDQTNGKVKWYLRIVDPSTETTWPDDVFAGFLPPNDETFRGEGHLTYRIKVRDDAPAEVKITNAATIVFDYNEAIETDPAWWNLVGEFNGLTVNLGGGMSTNLDLVANVPFGTLPTPIRRGYKFKGWFFGPNGTGGQITADTVVPSGLETIYPLWQIDGVALELDEIVIDEGSNLVVTVFGGNPDKATSAQVYLTYQTAAAADLDLAKGQLDGVTPKGGLKFPLTLSWAAGAVTNHAVSIPVKTDKTVEDDETLVFQLANAQGQALGEISTCKVTIRDANVAADYAAKQAIEKTQTKKGGETNALAVACVAGDGSGDVCGYTAGQGKYSKGSKVSLKATARPGWEFVGWYAVTNGVGGEAGDGAPGGRALPTGEPVSRSASWNVTLTNDAEIVALFGRVPYVAGGASPADGGKVTGSGYCAAGKKVTLKATANKNFSFVGWYVAEDGGRGATTLPDDALVSRLPSLVFDRSAKPAKSDAKQTVITNVSESVTCYALFKSDPEVFVIASCDDETGAELTGKGAGKFVAGTVTGAGKYAVGKKVTLKASANNGYVFAGWWPAEGGALGERPLPDGEPLSQAASYVIDKMPTNDVEIVAAFVTAETDKASIRAAVNGVAFPVRSDGDVASPLATNVWAGVYLEWPVAVSALSETKVKVTGLPSGLKFVDKPVTSKVGSGKSAITVTNIAANTIYGAPSTASKMVKAKDGTVTVTPSVVLVTVTTVGKSTQVYQIDTTVNPLPAWAVGTFAGPSYGDDDTNGAATVTIAASGKITAKQPVDGKVVSFAANWFDWYDAEGGAFWATLTAKSGSAVLTNEMVVSGHAGRVTLPAGGDQVVTNGVIEADRFDAWQYDWKTEPWKTVGKSVDKQTMAYYIASDGTIVDEDDEEGMAALGGGRGVTVLPVDGTNVTGKVTLKFAAGGAVTVAGEFVQLDADGQPVYKNKKLQTVKATGSATMLPYSDADGVLSEDDEADDIRYCVFIYVAPKNLPVHARCVEVTVDSF